MEIDRSGKLKQVDKLISILFVCHGNICRSPMAEFVFKDMVNKHGIGNWFEVASAAASAEEIGNGVHPGTRRKLEEHGIQSGGKTAVRLKREDYERFDYFIGMDDSNKKNMIRILNGDPKGKLSLLLDYTEQKGDIADPWYSNNFDQTYEDIVRGCQSFLEYVIATDERLTGFV